MATSNKRKICERVQTLIQALSLSGIDDDNIVLVDAVEDADQAFNEILTTLPGIVIMSAGPETIDPLGATTNSSDDIGYPVFIGLFADKSAASITPTTSDDTQAVWRETIRQTFIRQRLTDDSSNTLAYTCLCEPKDQVNVPMRRAFGTWLSFMVLRFVAREARG